MRDYFKSILKRMPSLIGVDPYKSMGDTPEEAKKAVSELLDALERVSSLYNYIPENAQKEIIERQLLVDKDWLKLNARLVGKWLEQNGKHYFKEVAHVETKQTGEIVTGEKRDQYIQDYLEAIAKVEVQTTPGIVPEHKGAGSKMKENLEKNGIVHEPKKEVSALEAACGVTEEMKSKPDPRDNPLTEDDSWVHDTDMGSR